MKTNRLTIALIGAVLLTGAAWAQEQEGGEPGRGVGRVSVINGDVSVRRGDAGEVVAAAINAPVVVDDRVMTGQGSRAEVQFDAANLVRLNGQSEIRLSQLDYRRYQVQVAIGMIDWRMRRTSDAEVEIATPTVSVRPLRKGSYKVIVREDGTTEITVRAGEAEIFTPRGSERLTQGRMMIARGNPQDPEFQVVNARNYDQFDEWIDRRERDLDHARSARYVNPDVYGAEELDHYGRWVDDPSYGQVWVPEVASDWAPYRYGRWSWVDYYGWTWVSLDPWGWAPYHYGRWYYGGYGWAWYPGPVHVRTYWSPALVAFFGWGGGGGFGVGVGFGFGHVGWVPLAPYEVCHPWWGRGYYGGYRSTTIVNNVNITNVNVSNSYRNARIGNAITGVNAGDFGRVPITHNGNNFVRPAAGDLSRAGLVRGQLPVTPSRESLRMADRPANTAGLPRSNENTRFFAHNQPTRVDRVPFEQQRQALGQFSQRTPGTPSGPVNNGAERGSFGRAQSPSGQSPQQGGNTGGWHRFGDPTPHAQTPGVSSNSPGRSRVDDFSGARQRGPNPSPSYSQPQTPNRPSYQPPSYQRPSNNGPSYSQPSQPRYDRPSSPPPNSGYRSSQPVRISPQIVQPRSGGNSGGGSSRPSSGGGGHSSGGGSHSSGGGSHGGRSR